MRIYAVDVNNKQVGAGVPQVRGQAEWESKTLSENKNAKENRTTSQNRRGEKTNPQELKQTDKQKLGEVWEASAKV